MAYSTNQEPEAKCSSLLTASRKERSESVNLRKEGDLRSRGSAFTFGFWEWRGKGAILFGEPAFHKKNPKLTVEPDRYTNRAWPMKRYI